MANMNYKEMSSEMNSWFDHAVRQVTQKATQIENDVFIPSVHSASQFARQRPITFTFLSIFAFLSTLPVLFFLAFSGFAALSFAVAALITAAFSTLVVVSVAGGFLLLTLTFFFGLAVFMTSALLGVFLLNRLVFHLRDNEGKGLTGWTGETKNRFIEVPQSHLANGIPQQPAPPMATTAHFARFQPQVAIAGDRSDDWQTTDDETVQLNVKPERIVI